VHGLRGDTSIDERARLDNQYIENWSLWRDVVILFQTFTAVIRNTFEPSGETGRSEPTPVLRIHRIDESTHSGNVEIGTVEIETVTPGAKEASSIG